MNRPSILDQRVLVLNNHWYPINTTTVFRAICSVYHGRAKFVDEEYFTTYNFNEWVQTWEDAICCAKLSEDRVVRCARFGIRVPEVIMYLHYRGTGYKKDPRIPRISRKNIFLRDDNRCQYCGKVFPVQDLTLDHVIPKSKGGKMCWENIVLCCLDCNRKKGAKTPEEVGMHLIRNPGPPSFQKLSLAARKRVFSRFGVNIPRSWEQFLGKLYWEIELTD